MKRSCLPLVLTAFLGIVGLTFFCKGFFPSKVILQGHGDFADGVSPFVNDSGSPHFRKLILVVVDALRSDFMFSEKSLMAFLQSLVRNGDAIPFTAYSNPPTVTLPRLKGITTGIIPSFVDAILNIADDNDLSQSLRYVDTWLSQFLRQNSSRRINFFGDDTWLKLFDKEQFFHECEGTSLFFVNDCIEVDKNVSRHLELQLSQNFDALILHYLGVDHIGHSGGPESVHMVEKQKEMDDVLEKLYQKGANDTLVIMMGDHGMNEVGNHGGSSEGETSPGLALISNKFRSCSSNRGLKCPLTNDGYEYYSKVDQIDLVPTLAALLNFPIPKNSVGVIMPQILDLWSSDVLKKKVLLENCEQLYRLLHAQLIKETSELQALLLNLRNLDKNSLKEYQSVLQELKRLLSKNSTNYSVPLMILGLCLVSLSSAIILVHTIAHFYAKKQNKVYEVILIGLLVMLYAIIFHGSSFIEEEHQYWWFINISAAALFIMNEGSNIYASFVYFASIRIVRSWSSLGQKLRTTKTLSAVFLESPNFLWVLVIITYIGLLTLCSRHSFNDKRNSSMLSVVVFLSGICSTLFKVLKSRIDGANLPAWLIILSSQIANSSDELYVIQERAVILSRVFYGAITVAILMRLTGHTRGKKTDISLLTIFLFLHQSRLEIIPIYTVFGIIEYSLIKIFDGSAKSSLVLTVLVLSIQHISFFAIGNSNLIATIDLSNAYNGLATYNLPIVSILTFISNFAPCLHWNLAWFRISQRLSSSQSWRIHLDQKNLITLSLYLTSLASLILSCIIQRFHLFIWSVFCPKVLYFAAWFIFVEIGFDKLLCQLDCFLK